MAEPPRDPGVDLMLAYQAGEENAFDRLVETYSGRVYSLLTRFLGPTPGREDLVQEVFLRVIRARQNYRPEARFSTWLYRIVYNLSLNERERNVVRQRRRPAPGVPEVELDPEHWADQGVPRPSAGLERDEVVRAVRAAIGALPETQRLALVLAKYEELPYADIADVLGSTEKAIKSLVHRARENLRVALAGFLQEETR